MTAEKRALLVRLLQEAEFDGHCDVCKERWVDEIEQEFGLEGLKAEVLPPEEPKVYTGTQPSITLSMVDSILKERYSGTVKESLANSDSLFSKLRG